MKKLYICAMEKEAEGIIKKLNMQKVKENTYTNETETMLITGIGKQRTAISLTKYLTENEKPDIAINIGYAGSTNIEIGTWVNVTKSYNYEWEIPGEEKYSMKDIGNQNLIEINTHENSKSTVIDKQDKEIKEDKEIREIKENKEVIKDIVIPKAPCYSAESFITKTHIQETVVFDMELHSIAIICDMYKIPLVALKMISDNLSMDKYYENIEKKEIKNLETCLDII